jgi:hypothetical protein
MFFVSLVGLFLGFFCFVLFCFGGTGVLNSGLCAHKAGILSLDHTSSPFYSSYFGDESS